MSSIINTGLPVTATHVNSVQVSDIGLQNVDTQLVYPPSHMVCELMRTEHLQKVHTVVNVSLDTGISPHINEQQQQQQQLQQLLQLQQPPIEDSTSLTSTGHGASS